MREWLEFFYLLIVSFIIAYIIYPFVVYMLVCYILSDKGAEEVTLYQLQKVEEEYLKERK